MFYIVHFLGVSHEVIINTLENNNYLIKRDFVMNCITLYLLFALHITDNNCILYYRHLDLKH